jgi:hypothetical protein
MRKRRARPTLRPLPSLIAEPPPMQQLVNRRAVKDTWNDPSDDKPGASRTARQVAGYRQYCPLRRCRQRHGERSSFSTQHIEAADKLRACFDGSRLGFSGLRGLTPVTTAMYRPALGPAKPALRQLRCREQFDAAWALFSDQARALLLSCVLLNRAITRTAALLGVSPPWTTQKLVEVLDVLCDHFEIGERKQRRRAA